MIVIHKNSQNQKIDGIIRNGIGSLQSLTFISALFGSLSIIPTYFLSENFFDKRVGVLSAVLLSLTPAHLLFSEVAMTDIVSLFFITTTVYMLYLGIESRKCLYVGSVLLGVTAGIRQTDALLIPLLLVVLLYRKKIKEWAISLSLALGAACLWLIPVIWYTGFNTFIKVQKIQWEANNVWRTFNSSGGMSALESINRLFVEGWSYVFFIFILITLIVIIIKINNNSINKFVIDKRLIFIVGWLALYFIFSFLYYELNTSRYLLPLFPPLSIIFAYSIIKIIDFVKKEHFKAINILFFAILIVFMGNQAITNAYTIHTTTPAPVKAAEFIKEHYDPQDTIITASDSFRHLQYYLPNFTVKYGTMTPSDEIYFILENKTILSEGSPILFNVDTTYRQYEFKRDHKIYPKHEYVKLYENKPDYRKQSIVLGGDGWYGIENWSGIPTRWMGADAVMQIYSNENQTAMLNFQVLSLYRPRTLDIYNGGLQSAEMKISSGFVTIKMPINLKEGLNTIRFHVLEGCERPLDIPELQNKDARCLGMAFRNITLTSNLP